MSPINPDVSDTFTFHCAWGCIVRVHQGKQMPHNCDGTSLIVDILRMGTDPKETFGQLAERIARGLDPDLRALRTTDPSNPKKGSTR